MLPRQLANFLLYNLHQTRIGFVILFHCWSNNEILQFAHQINMQNKPIYTQYVNLNGMEDWLNFELRFLQHFQPTLGIYVDASCPQAGELMKQASQEQLYNQHYHWLLHATQPVAGFYEFFSPFNISVDADVSYVQAAAPTIDSIVYRIYDVYNNGKHIGGQLNMTADRELSCNLSSCQLLRYLSDLHLRSKYANRGALTDVVLRVATVVTKQPITLPTNQLIEFLSQTNETHIDGISRFGFQVLLILKDLLRCDIQYIFSDRWSNDDLSGGIVGNVTTQLADIGSTPWLATEGRLRYLSPIIETGYFRSVCMFRTPRNAGIRGDVFLQPFSPTVWCLFMATLLLTALLLWLTFRLERNSMAQPWPCVPSLLSTLLLTFGAACNQSAALVPRSAGGRLACFSLFLISFIMYNYYTSVVVSSLLSSPVKSKVKTLQQLAESDLPVGLEPLSFTKSYLNYSNRPELHLFRQRKVIAQAKNPKLWLPAEEGVLRVRDQPGFVFVLESSSGYAYVERYYTPQQICDINEILFRPERLLYTHLHRNSSYKELIRLKLLRASETGVYRKQRNHWVRTRLHCFAQNYAITVGMEYVAPLFFMLVLGYALVLLLLMIELSWKRYTTAYAPAR